MPIKKEKLDSIKGYREYQKKSGAAAAVSSLFLRTRAKACESKARQAGADLHLLSICFYAKNDSTGEEGNVSDVPPAADHAAERRYAKKSKRPCA